MMSTMGASASTGTVCEATTQGMSARSGVRACTISAASTQPNRPPSTKPSSVACAVIQVCSSRLRGESTGQSNTPCHRVMAIWCGAGSTGRGADQVASSQSLQVHGLFIGASTCCAALWPLSSTANPYQSSTNTAPTASTGKALP